MKKVFSLLLCLCLVLSLSLPVSAQSQEYTAVILIDDRADLLSNAQQSKLSGMSVTADFPFTVVISTVDSIGSMTPEQFANDRYDSITGSNNGILLLVAMQSRDWYILTVGEVHARISDSDCQTMAERFLPALSSGRYYSAFDAFLTDLTSDLDNSYTLPMLLIAAAIGLIAGTVTILIMRGQMKTAKRQRSATGYVKSGSFNLHTHFDFYLYSRVTKTPRPKSTSSGGGGGSRGGSGGKF